MDIFSYHLIDAPFHQILWRLLGSRALTAVDGLRHFELLMTMKMGRSVASPFRFNYRTLAFFAWWENESALEAFLERPRYGVFQNPGWHVRMALYRRWGTYAELDDAPLHKDYSKRDGHVVAVTLARLKLQHTFRFAKWGKPVEAQIRDHGGKTCARVAYRPINTFSTFSIWESERAMVGMVKGLEKADGREHKDALVERARKPFHFEFTTLRFAPLSHHGDWERIRDETTPQKGAPLVLPASRQG